MESSKDPKNTPKEAKSPSPEISIRGTSPEGSEIDSFCVLPDGRRVCSFHNGKIGVIPSGKLPQDIEIKFNPGFSVSFEWLEGSRVIARNYYRVLQVLNIDTGEIEEIDRDLTALDAKPFFARLKTQDGTEYLVAGMKDRVRVYHTSSLAKPILEYTFELVEVLNKTGDYYLQKKRIMNGLTVVDDKIVVGVGDNFDKAGLVVLSIERNSLYAKYFDAFDAETPKVLGNGKYMALYESDYHSPKAAFGILRPEGYPRHIDCSSDNECFQPKYTLPEEIHFSNIQPIEGTSLFCFTNPTNSFVLHIINPQAKQLYTLKLPIEHYGRVTMSADGQITYLSKDGRLVELTYKTQGLQLVQELASQVTLPVLGMIVGGYVGPDVGEPTLSRKNLDKVMFEMKITQDQLYPKEKKEGFMQKFSKIFSQPEKPQDLSHIPFIKKMLQEPGDTERYMIALEFVTAHQTNEFAQAIAEVMSPKPKDLKIDASVLA
ncbi:MAG: hypothetical protein ACYCQI_14635, partial [Gammaproteobacteria bacterium]